MSQNNSEHFNNGAARTRTPEEIAIEKRQREEPTVITRLPDLQRQLRDRNAARERAGKNSKYVTGFIVGTTVAAIAAVGIIFTHNSKSQERPQKIADTSAANIPPAPKIQPTKELDEVVRPPIATAIPTAEPTATAEASADLPKDIDLDNEIPSAVPTIQPPKKQPPKQWPPKAAASSTAKKAPSLGDHIIRETPF